MKVETIEVILVCAIVSIQLYVFARTFIQISLFRSIIPNVTSLKISKVLVPVSDIKRLSPKEILANITSYKSVVVNVPTNGIPVGDLSDLETPTLFEESDSNHDIERAEVNIIESEVKTNHILDNILFSLNNYLIRNRGAASDFNLIKDVIERNTNAVEEDINLSIGVPLYLGLMGTMIGIVIGLFNMPDLGAVLDTKAKDVMLNDGIGLLIGGVKIAMIASFSGLMLTIINSGWVFKGSRSLSESRKNDFYTFVQIELLPIINQGLASTLESLQRNLLKFNNEFTVNLRQLTGIFDSNTRTIKAQKELLDTIDKTKVAEMTSYNVKVLQQLDVSVTQFEKFNGYMTNVTLFVENSQHIVNRTNELLARTDNFKAIAENLDNKLNQSQQLLEFLSSHFKKLEEHKEFTSNAVADVGSAISEIFKELKEHIQNSSEAVKNFTVDELELLRTALSESKTNLGNLEHLAIMKTDLAQMKISSASQLERLKSDLERTIQELQNICGSLKTINTTIDEKGVVARVKKSWKWITAKK
jgi:gas vesicle protein